MKPAQKPPDILPKIISEALQKQPASKPTLSISDLERLLREGILLTDNTLRQRPLETILTVNSHIPQKNPLTSYISRADPIRVKLAKTPKFLHLQEHAKATGDKRFGYGPFYHPAYFPTRLNTPYIPVNQQHLPRIDTSIHPRNSDPVHDPIEKRSEFYEESVAGTRWLLQNLQYTPPQKLPDIYLFPEVLEVYKKGLYNWATGYVGLANTECSVEAVKSNAKIKPSENIMVGTKGKEKKQLKGLSKIWRESLQTEICITKNYPPGSLKTPKITPLPPSLICLPKSKILIKTVPLKVYTPEKIPDAQTQSKLFVAAFAGCSSPLVHSSAGGNCEKPSRNGKKIKLVVVGNAGNR
ncbi:hypothetical protein HK100_010254 [Physocladia obscura]|uniref:Uncharacterized protein n=1 Tax=Physocladia obscura TaxID=109957 RepID=A0AAD5TAI6_9FUNG|nr:hypothetical protein HK100_010254 [Physocladia obscura]